MNKQILVVLLAFYSGTGFAAVEKPMEGFYLLAGKFGIKSPEQGTSHLYLSISGDAAKDLYQSINAVEHENHCTGETDKQINAFVCSKTPQNKYHCNFAVDLEKGTIAMGLGGCI